ncbi:hypothetical protein SOM11_12195 [Frigoribacterium sp. CFBP9039]|uniref:lipopolysaccharide biosynthesis protein n=1 Tax=Frigoribacterium sp. CFBP9029 TaxID=3096541 RepID=UPI002A69E03C|nr:hypothetical protein [Frigoribacterium sp. CFBP9039]MDY0946747.1 hypothetical protein [Frigoribacterium sp. CFBP9039]
MKKSGSGPAVLAARLLSLAAAAAQLPFLTRALPAEAYGTVAIVFALSSYFALFGAEPATLAFQRHPGSNGERGNYGYARARLIASMAILAVIVCVAGLLASDIEVALAVAAWGSGLAVARFTATAWLMWNRPWAYASNLMTSTSLRTLTLIGLILLGEDGMLAVATAGLVSTLASLLLAPRSSKTSRKLETPPWPRQLGYQLALASLGVTVLASANLIVLQHFSSSEAAAPFAAMSQLAVLSSAALISLYLTVQYPSIRLSWDSGNESIVDRRLQRTSFMILAVGSACIAAFIFGNGWLPSRIVNPDLVDLPILTLLVAASTMAGLSQVNGWRLQLRLRAGSLAIRSSATALALILLLFFFIPRVDAPSIGAAVVTLLGLALHFCMTGGKALMKQPVLIGMVIIFIVAVSSTFFADLVYATVACSVFATASALVAVKKFRSSS